MRDNSISEAEFIAQAKKDFSEYPEHVEVDNVLGVCEAYYMNGSHDDIDGDVETFGHFYRVHRWIVWTDNYGFHELETYDNEDEAVKAFEKYSEEYAATFETEDCY